MRFIRFARACATLPLLALAACAPDIPAQNLKIDIPAAYSEKSNGETPALDWWRAFRQPELSRLMALAQSANLDIAAAIARIEQADAQARLAAAPLFPVLGGSASATNSKSSAFDARVSPPARTTHQLGLNASYELDFWGKNRASADAAEASALATRYDAETVRLSTQAALANTYFAILASRERLRLVNENLTVASRVLTLINQRLAVGTATALDQAQQESVVANLRANIPPFQQNIAQNTDVLALLTGRAAPRVHAPSGRLMAASIPHVRPGLPSDLLVRRPDIAFAEASLDASGANLAAARAAFYPSIQLTAQGGFQSLALNTLLDPKNIFTSLAAGLTQPIFDAGKLQGNFDQIKGRQDELIANYKKSVLSGFADVEKALAAQRYQSRLEGLQHASLASSQRAYELSEQRLREGTVDLVTVLNTQNTLFQVQDALVQTRLARLQAAVSLYQALGGGWPHVTVPRNNTR